jgi:nicotinamidase-related amidase
LSFLKQKLDEDKVKSFYDNLIFVGITTSNAVKYVMIELSALEYDPENSTEIQNI